MKESTNKYRDPAKELYKIYEYDDGLYFPEHSCKGWGHMGRSEETDKAVSKEQRDTLVLSTLTKTWIFDLDGILVSTT